MWRRLLLALGFLLCACVLQKNSVRIRSNQPRKKPEIADWENEGGAPRPAEETPESANAPA